MSRPSGSPPSVSRPSPLRRLLSLAAPVRGWVLLAALASFGALAANVALMTAAPYLISKATLVTGFAALAVAVTAVRAFAIARAALRYSERYVAHLAALRVLTEIRVWLYRAIEPLAPSGLRAFRGGDLLARTVADVDTLDAFFVRGIVPPAAATLTVALACVIMGAVAPALGLVAFAFLALGGVALGNVVKDDLRGFQHDLGRITGDDGRQAAGERGAELFGFVLGKAARLRFPFDGFFQRRDAESIAAGGA